jgi:hypothetical protein
VEDEHGETTNNEEGNHNATHMDPSKAHDNIASRNVRNKRSVLILFDQSCRNKFGEIRRNLIPEVTASMAPAPSLEEVINKLSNPKELRNKVIIASGMDDIKRCSAPDIQEKLDIGVQIGKSSYPDATFYLLSILPNAKWSNEISTINQYMQSMSRNDERVVYVNTYDVFRSRSTLLQSENTPNSEGLRLIEECIREKVAPETWITPKHRNSKIRYEHKLPSHVSSKPTDRYLSRASQPVSGDQLGRDSPEVSNSSSGHVLPPVANCPSRHESTPTSNDQSSHALPPTSYSGCTLRPMLNSQSRHVLSPTSNDEPWPMPTYVSNGHTENMPLHTSNGLPVHTSVPVYNGISGHVTSPASSGYISPPVESGSLRHISTPTPYNGPGTNVASSQLTGSTYPCYSKDANVPAPAHMEQSIQQGTMPSMRYLYQFWANRQHVHYQPHHYTELPNSPLAS